MPMEMQDFWPSLMEPNQLEEHEPQTQQEALTADDFES
jgi:hypothetical protein